MKKYLIPILYIFILLISGCNLPIAAVSDGMTEEEAVSATMTAWVEHLDATATALVAGNSDIVTNTETGGGEEGAAVAELVVEEDISWCPAIGYMTHRSGDHQIAYWPVSSAGRDQVVFEGFIDPIYQGEAIVPLDGDGDPDTFSLVYFMASDDAVHQWKNMESLEIVREEVFKSHLLMAPASEKLAFSVVNSDGSEIFVATISAAGFAQPLLKSSYTGSSLDPVRMLLDDAGNLIGIYVTYVDTTTIDEYWYRSGRRLIYVDLSTGEAKDILTGEWRILDVSQTGRLAVIVDSEEGNAITIYEINQRLGKRVDLCEGCIDAGAALIRPDDGMVAWTEKMRDNDEYVLRVADSGGNLVLELNSTDATGQAGFTVDALQAKGWLSSGILLVDSGNIKNQVFALNIVTGQIEWKSSGNFLSLVYDPELCK